MNDIDLERLTAAAFHEAEGAKTEPIEWLDEVYQISAEQPPLYAYVTFKDGTLTLQHDTHEEYIQFDSVDEITSAIMLLQEAKRLMNERAK